jgi:excisionase family DNA binding protein
LRHKAAQDRQVVSFKLSTGACPWRIKPGQKKFVHPVLLYVNRSDAKTENLEIVADKCSPAARLLPTTAASPELPYLGPMSTETMQPDPTVRYGESAAQAAPICGSPVGGFPSLGEPSQPDPQAKTFPIEELNSRLIGKKELSEYFGVDIRTIENWMASHKIPFIKIGKTVRFRLADVIKHIDEHFTVRPRHPLVGSLRNRVRT